MCRYVADCRDNTGEFRAWNPAFGDLCVTFVIPAKAGIQVALACSQPPEGRVSWTLQMLADGLVAQEIVDSISTETVPSEKNELKPWLKECWCLPPQGSADFVCAKDVLEVYHRPYGEGEVLVCLDETSKQLVQETRQPRPSRPGAAMAYDYEYQRNGVSNLFMLFAPLEGWRRVEVSLCGNDRVDLI